MEIWIVNQLGISYGTCLWLIHLWKRQNWMVIYDFLVQDCSISIANLLEMQQSCTKPWYESDNFSLKIQVQWQYIQGCHGQELECNVALTLWNFTWRPNEEWTTQKLDDVGCISMQHAQTNWGWGLGKLRNTHAQPICVSVDNPSKIWLEPLKIHTCTMRALDPR